MPARPSFAAFALLVVTPLGACGRPPRDSPPEAAARAASAPSPSAPAEPRWRVPPCPLRYELRTEEVFTGEHGKPTRLLSLFDVSLAPKGERVELTTGVTYWFKRGKYLPYAQRTRELAPVELAIDPDGRTVREAAGPSQIFRALGTQGGFVSLFPPLPGPASGARTTWRIERPESTVRHNGLHVADKPQPDWRAGGVAPLDLEVRITSAAPVAGGAPALTLASAGKDIYAPPSPPAAEGLALKFSALGDVRAEHVVLASGRLLRATFERHADLRFDAAGNLMRSRLDQRSEAHLVGACDGPTLPPLAPALGREERAIAALGELAVAVYEGKRGDALARLDGALRRAHGDDALWRTVGRFREGAGESAWPMPLFVEDEDVRGDAEGVTVTMRSNVRHPTAANTMTPVRFEARLAERGGAFVVTQIAGSFEIEPGKAERLAITPARLVP